MSSEAPTVQAQGEESTKAPCPNHGTHPFRFPELGIGTGSNEQAYFRAMIFFSKKPGLTDEFFHEHWKSVHADLTMQVEDAGVLFSRYVQFHQEQKDRDAVASLIGTGMQLMPFDGAAEIHCKDAESFVKFMHNVYNAKHLVGCGSRFVDMDNPYSIMVGYDNLIFGASAASADGQDGILPGDARINTSTSGEKEDQKEDQKEDK